MLACLDVSYGVQDAVAACLLFRAWHDAALQRSLTAHIPNIAPYQPGAFYQWELPCLLAVLQKVEDPLELIVVDGYVWLSAEGRPGLDAWLFEALGGRVAIVGVAKTSFHGAPGFAEPVLRGGSARPLYVTAAGADPAVAAGWIRAMHGAHRIPTLLRRVDQLCCHGDAE
jgi:deoxyribonuclease V